MKGKETHRGKGPSCKGLEEVFVKCPNCGNIELSHYYTVKDTVKVPKDRGRREIVLATTTEIEDLMHTEGYVCDRCGHDINELN